MIKILIGYFVSVNTLILKLISKGQKPRIDHKILKKDKLGRLTILNLRFTGSSLVGHWVKDPVWCRLQLWHSFDLKPGELPHAVGVTKKEKKKKKAFTLKRQELRKHSVGKRIN